MISVISSNKIHFCANFPHQVQNTHYKHVRELVQPRKQTFINNMQHLMIRHILTGPIVLGFLELLSGTSRPFGEFVLSILYCYWRWPKRIRSFHFVMVSSLYIQSGSASEGITYRIGSQENSHENSNSKILHYFYNSWSSSELQWEFYQYCPL